MTTEIQRITLKIFRRYSNSLGPEVLEFVEHVVDEHETPSDEIEEMVETLAREYNKQDDALMKVSLDVLTRVYETLRDQGKRSEIEQETVDPESHLHFIDAFEMPAWNWSQERGTFDKATHPPTIGGTADSRIIALRNRLNIVRQCVLRNEHFTPSTLPSRDRDRLVTLRSTKQLLGRPGERFLLLGMLAHNPHGKVCIEDADGSVVLDFSKLEEPGDGLFTEGCIALVEGEYTDDDTLEIIAIGQPPCESREVSRSIYGHIDFLGKGATSLTEDAQLVDRVQEDLADLQFFCFSDVWLDHPPTIPGLERIFDNCVENNFVPKVIVLCGNFTSHSISHGNAADMIKYQENFNALADLISAYPRIARFTHFVLVPGPLDVTINGVLPRKPLLSSFVSRLKAKVPKLHLASNPCRIKFFHEEIVIFRDDITSRMLRNVIGIKPDSKSDDLKRFLVQTVLDQGHLCPFTIDIQPTLHDYDHSMRLYPLPTALILADKYERYKLTYTGCHVFNPGSFVGNNLAWSMYKPADANSEECILDIESE